MMPPPAPGFSYVPTPEEYDNLSAEEDANLLDDPAFDDDDDDAEDGGEGDDG